MMGAEGGRPSPAELVGSVFTELAAVLAAEHTRSKSNLAVASILDFACCCGKLCVAAQDAEAVFAHFDHCQHRQVGPGRQGEQLPA